MPLVLQLRPAPKSEEVLSATRLRTRFRVAVGLTWIPPPETETEFPLIAQSDTVKVSPPERKIPPPVLEVPPVTVTPERA
jgi:hypothetical protein